MNSRRGVNRTRLAAAVVGWIAIVAVVTTFPAGARADAYADLLAADKIVWIGAHPDDEVFTTPLLADLCRYNGKDCHVITVTQGESGPCNLCTKPGGPSCPCGTFSGGVWSTLGPVRAAEEIAATSYLDMGLTHWSFSNAPGATPQARLAVWNEESVSGTFTGDLIDELIGLFDPEEENRLILFDPRHGSTCHVEHRATAMAAIAATEALASRLTLDDVFLAENLFDPGQLCECPQCHLGGGFLWRGFRPAVPGSLLEVFDGTPRWSDMITVAGLYPSQFGNPQLTLATDPQQDVWIVRATDAQLGQPSAFAEVCNEQGKLPCVDLCEQRCAPGD